VRHERFRFSLLGVTGCVLVVAMALAPLSAGVNALGEAAHNGVIGLCGVAAVRALVQRSRDRAFRLGFAASSSIFLLVSGWFHIPGVSGRPDLGRVLEAALAIAIGIIAGLLVRRFTATASRTGQVASSLPLSSRGPRTASADRDLQDTQGSSTITFMDEILEKLCACFFLGCLLLPPQSSTDC
jgi:hypothetical protein